MSITLKDIETRPNGAQFFNADLHIHTYGGSHDVRDMGMTPEAVIDTARSLGINIIAVTDHNTDANVKRAVDYAVKYHGEMLVLPGVEISTAHGHLLVYFAPTEADKVRTLLARVNIVGNLGDQDAHTTMSMADVITQAQQLDGVCIAAHIDRTKTGFEMILPGYPGWKRDILLHPGLYGLEFDDAANLKWFSADDDHSSAGIERGKFAAARQDNAVTKGRPYLARVQGSDAHTVNALTAGRGGKILTRFKLDELSFAAFKVALADPEARVRAVAEIPRSVPRILGMHVSGGFLDGEIYRFSDNLNCFIGGRGTGKSSALQALAFGLGIDNKMAERDTCPDSIVTYCEDANGIRYRYERLRGGDLVVKAKEDGDPVTEVPADAFRVEYYPQGELARVGADPLKTPALFQEFLDRHLLLTDLLEKEKSLVASLKHNSAQLIPLLASKQSLPTKQKDQQEIDAKLKLAEDGKLKDIVAEQKELSAERALKATLAEVRDDYNKKLTLKSFERNYDQFLVETGKITTASASIAALEKIKAAIGRMNATLRAKEKEINDAFVVEAKAIDAALMELSLSQKKVEADSNIRLIALQQKGLAGSITELQTLLKRKEALVLEIAKIGKDGMVLKKLQDDRAEAIKALAEVRNQITERRKAQLATINQNLARTINDYNVFVQYESSGITTEFKDYFLQKMQGTWFKEEQAVLFCAKIMPAELAGAILAGTLPALCTAAGIDPTWAPHIFDRLKLYLDIHELEVMWKPPFPAITVRTKSTPPKQIPVNQLSDGQKHTIMLTIAMLAESNIPLVIDQPEDDLDNAFIFSAVVRVLRTIKERRQVVLVTHNANIAVLGDAELLLPMKRNGDGGAAFDRGSIDTAGTQAAVLSILEGGDIAFQRRSVIYGY